MGTHMETKFESGRISDHGGYIIQESSKTRRSREKLEKQWEARDRLVTETALAETIHKIAKWIATRAKDRVFLEKKDLALFDNNQNPAPPSRKVERLAQSLTQGYSLPSN